MKYTKEEKEIIKDALIVMLSNVYRIGYLNEGLCRLNIISSHANSEKYFLVRGYIKNNRVNMFSSLDAFGCFITCNSYWWTPGEVKPRKKWLIKHINKLSK